MSHLAKMPSPGGRRPTLVPKTTEAIRHNCEDGHVWFAMMYPVSHSELWAYTNRKQRWCPDCGKPQADEEEIA